MTFVNKYIKNIKWPIIETFVLLIQRYVWQLLNLIIWRQSVAATGNFCHLNEYQQNGAFAHTNLHWMYSLAPRRKRLKCLLFFKPMNLLNKGRHCCSVGELKITFASTCKESVFNVLFNVLFLVLDFPLGAPNTLLKHVIERSIWGIVVGEGSWWGWGFSQDWWLGFWSCWNLSLTAVFWIDFSVACFKRV